MKVSTYIKLFKGEKIVPLRLKRTPRGFLYAVTNYGRVISYTEKPEEGRLLRLGFVTGYPSFSARVNGKSLTFFVHRLVAKYFLKQPSTKHKFVIHLDYDKEENYFKNLKWVTREESVLHTRLNQNRRRSNQKLMPDTVYKIKLKLREGKSTLKKIAKQFGVTDMQIHRIKTGENWGHIKLK